jgi:hypothetical protein
MLQIHKNYTMKKLSFLLCLISSILIYQNSFSQVKIDSSEITSSVPELTSFHETIFPIWHSAYPAKDINALKGFVPQIKASMDALNKAALPGILKDKENLWKNQLQQFNVAADNYYKAAGENDDEALLTAAEELHHNFEMMNRVIRPVMKEMDDYHQILYIMYHKLYPDKKYDKIAGLMDSLIERADAIRKYPREKLKKRLGDNISKFDPAANELYNSTVALKEVLNGNDTLKKSEAVQYMHSRYQNLEAVFK